MATSWCKVASNLDSHPKIRRAGRNGREVFLFALRRNAEPNNPVTGVLPALMFEPWYLADQLMMTEGEAVEGLQRCFAAGLLLQNGQAIHIDGWDDEEWGREKSTERVREWRKQKKTEPLKQDETLRNVSHVAATEVKRDETKETARGEERRGDQNIYIPPAPKKPRKQPERPLPDDWKPTPEHAELARERGLDLELQAQRFRNHAHSKDRRAVRWNAAFSNWLLGTQAAHGFGRPGAQAEIREVQDL